MYYKIIFVLLLVYFLWHDLASYSMGTFNSFSLQQGGYCVCVQQYGVFIFYLFGVVLVEAHVF